MERSGIRSYFLETKSKENKNNMFSSLQSWLGFNEEVQVGKKKPISRLRKTQKNRRPKKKQGEQQQGEKQQGEKQQGEQQQGEKQGEPQTEPASSSILESLFQPTTSSSSSSSQEENVVMDVQEKTETDANESGIQDEPLISKANMRKTRSRRRS
jgi:hypothetical protein